MDPGFQTARPQPPAALLSSDQQHPVLCSPSEVGASYSSRATVRPQTDPAPEALRAEAQASSVAPVVQTSSDVWTRHTPLSAVLRGCGNGAVSGQQIAAPADLEKGSLEHGAEKVPK